MSQTRIAKLSSKPRGGPPGDQARVMTAAAADETGKVWPRGTVFTPLCGGADGIHTSYATVSIGLDRVTFRFDR